MWWRGLPRSTPRLRSGAVERAPPRRLPLPRARPSRARLLTLNRSPPIVVGLFFGGALLIDSFPYVRCRRQTRAFGECLQQALQKRKKYLRRSFLERRIVSLFLLQGFYCQPPHSVIR